MNSLRVLIVALFIAGCSTTKQATPPLETSTTEESTISTTSRKHPLDKSEYRRFALGNGLRVLVVSDPRFNKSAASMLVETGSLDNPPDRQGLAHFLEHMLFLGTEKYPGVDDYGTYITENGGYDNAYTSGDHTNYFFEINHEALEGGLDRFAQFFIAPLFTQDYTDRELSAVNSEHQRRLENDDWREYRVMNLFYREGHPERLFSTGSLETLGGVTREELLSFYRERYSSDRMVLTILGKAPLDSLDTWAHRHFSTIADLDLSKPTYEPDFIPSREIVRLITIEPVQDIRTLGLAFDVPGLREHYQSKPHEIISSLLGHEGTGSLLSHLKNANFATGLSASMYPVTDDYGVLTIKVHLTPEGFEAHKEVTKTCLAYLKMMKAKDYPEYHFREERTLAELNEVYSDRGEGGAYATELARLISDYSLETAERVPYLYGDPDPTTYSALLSYLTPDNMLITLSAKGVSTDQIEPHHGTKYGYSEDSAFYASLIAVTPEGLRLPEPNLFIPDGVEIPDRASKAQGSPSMILDEPGLRLYHSLDTEFLRPKVSLRFKIRFPADRMSLRFKVLLDTYTECVNESLNELAYSAGLAGLDYSFSSDYEGVFFSIGGYNGSAEKLFSHFLDHMKDLKISEERYAAIKDRLVREIKNFSKQEAWRITSARIGGMRNAVDYRPEDRLHVLESIVLGDVMSFAQSLYDRIYVEALVHGNLSTDEATALTKALQSALGSSPVSSAATFEQTTLSQPEPENVRMVEKLEVNNSCYRGRYLLGPTTPEKQAVAAVIGLFIEQRFFTEMRTNQQLGYIVGSGDLPLDDKTYVSFIIQSADYPADELERRATTFVSTYRDSFEALGGESFDGLRTAAIEKLKEKAKTISERSAEFHEQAYKRSGDFAYKKKVIASLEALTQGKVSSALGRTLSKETGRVRTLLAFAKQHEIPEVPDAIVDVGAWKKSRTFD